ncbi:hypothetical protein [Bradyrhizobium sp. Tv2a-2]|uniref:hypothetical protein n=1 Tax=Bradyrhizobium sp. Tv2a-2 TaxID=113395 RepID=UPI0003F8FAF8|nr:hypothetical protein [Bradyrhizobium sp. Tv2a-2]
MLINPFRRSRSDGPFRTRAPARDQELDNQLVGQVASAIDDALQKIEAQRDGLKRRLDDVIARAAIVGGNDLDDFLTRDEARASLLAASDDEIARGQVRLKTLDEQLSHFRFLKAALQTRFPDFKADGETIAG